MTNIKDLASSNVKRAMETYTTGTQISCKHKLNANENIFKPLSEQEIEKVVCDAVKEINLYPDESCEPLRAKAAKHYGVHKDNIVAGNGSSSLLSTIFSTFLEDGDIVATTSPTFTLYKKLGIINGATVEETPWIKEFPSDDLIRLGAKITVVASPNNPTGTTIDESCLIRLLETTKGIVILDEAYADFNEISFTELTKEFENLIIVKTFSKAVGAAGVRLGFVVASKAICRYLNVRRDTYNVNVISQRIGEAIFDKYGNVTKNTKKLNSIKESFEAKLIKSGIRILSVSGNFTLIQVDDADEISNRLKDNGILVRNLGDGLIRISTGSEAAMDEVSCLLIEPCN